MINKNWYNKFYNLLEKTISIIWSIRNHRNDFILNNHRCNPVAIMQPRYIYHHTTYNNKKSNKFHQVNIARSHKKSQTHTIIKQWIQSIGSNRILTHQDSKYKINNHQLHLQRQHRYYPSHTTTIQSFLSSQIKIQLCDKSYLGGWVRAPGVYMLFSTAFANCRENLRNKRFCFFCSVGLFLNKTFRNKTRDVVNKIFKKCGTKTRALVGN